MTKSIMGGKGLFVYTSISQTISKGSHELTQGRNLEAAADREATKECCLLACSSWFAQSAFSQDHQPMGGIPHNGLGPPPATINQENASHRLAYGPITGRHFLNGGPCLSDDSNLCQVENYQGQ